MVRAARVGARSFAARNECLEEVEDDCDDKEYERHGVPSEAGVFPCLRCHVSTLNVPKTSRNSEKTDLDDIAFFGGGIETMPRQKITCSGVQEYRVRRFFGRAKMLTMPIPCRIGKANTSVRAEIGGAEHSQYYCSPACGNGIRNRKDIGARPCFFRALRAPNLDENLSICYIFVVRRALRRLLPLSLKGEEG